MITQYEIKSFNIWLRVDIFWTKQNLILALDRIMSLAYKDVMNLIINLIIRIISPAL